MSSEIPAGRRIFNPDELQQLEDLQAKVLERVLPAVLPDILRREFELVGIDTSNPDTRLAVRKDNEFVRTLRMSWDGTSHKVGNAVILLALLGILAFAGYGLKSRLIP